MGKQSSQEAVTISKDSESVVLTRQDWQALTHRAWTADAAGAEVATLTKKVEVCQYVAALVGSSTCK
jgi:hypothetical protein